MENHEFICKNRDKYFKMNSQELFLCEKDAWYEERQDLGGKSKIWDQEFVEHFWREIQNSIKDSSAKQDLNFSGFIFPFFKKRDKFNGFCPLNISFQQDIFENNVKFNDCIFLDGADFSDIEFKGDISFYSTKVNGLMNFSKSKFRKNFKFQNCYNENLSGIEDDPPIKIKFQNTILSSKYSNQFKKIIFRDSNLQNISFPDKALFRNCDLSQVSFLDSNIEKVQFDECKFLKSEQGNLMLYDEKKVSKRENSTKDDFEQVENLYRQLKKNFDEKKDFQTADDFYVGEMDMMKKKLEKEQKHSFWEVFWKIQPLSLVVFIMLIFFKKGYLGIHESFFADNIWILLAKFLVTFISISMFSIVLTFGYAYLLKEKDVKFNNWGKLTIITFYKLISNYNSSPFQALLSLFILISVFTVFYIPQSDPSWGTALDYSFTNAIPFIEFSDENIKKEIIKNSFVKTMSYLQKIISAGIILLFGLSLRRKFKR